MWRVRLNLAMLLAHCTGKMSQKLGRGQGAMIGGLFALKVDPGIIGQLTENKATILITGTNGKSTTTRMIAQALLGQGKVATQLDGANMDAGIASALIAQPKADFAVLEVDELHVPHIGHATNPRACVLLNLSRDQLDRYGELGAVERALRFYVQDSESCIIANCDDVLVVSAAWEAKQVIWVAAGSSWKSDAVNCPRTGEPIIFEQEQWHSMGDATFRRPAPHWWFDDTHIYQSDGYSYPLELQLPGTFNRANAVMAVAAAVYMGVPVAEAIAAISQVNEVSGRYRNVNIAGREVRLLLAKNPAGWQECLKILSERKFLQNVKVYSENYSAEYSIIISVNGKIQDGQDLSWLWDVDFESLPEITFPDNSTNVMHSDAKVICTGERAYDLAVRLSYAGISYRIETDILSAIKSCPPGEVDILANYTAFMDLNRVLKTISSQKDHSVNMVKS